METMTFLRQIQNLFERTYAPTGVNLEDCLIGEKRCHELSILAGPSAHDLSLNGRTFLRISNGRLYLAIYYHPSVISALEEHYPFAELSESNIRELITFLEELNHAVHASLLFLENRLDIEQEEVLCNLELQAKIDTYLVLKLIITILRDRRQVLVKQERWLQRCLFHKEHFTYDHEVLRHRYYETNRLGLKLVRHLDKIESEKRIELIRDFRPMPYEEKKKYILSLHGRG
jgi:hypothetical protein